MLLTANCRHKVIQQIKQQTRRLNKDNISRTNAYKTFYDTNPEIKWALLASAVSRNAGWTMTDLKGRLFQKGLTSDQQTWLFTTYERSNWLIFSDAFPQLLLYSYSKRCGTPLFSMLGAFGVSAFMETEWQLFWHEKDKKRLMHALIINEQNTIQKPIIQNHWLKKNVFAAFPFLMSDYFHFNTVIFPTIDGRLLGLSINNFTKAEKRIALGKKLGKLLFHPVYHTPCYQFLDCVPHTGSRYDMEKMMGRKIRTSPFLRTCYPVVIHSLDEEKDDWFRKNSQVRHSFKEVNLPDQVDLTEWYQQKRRQLEALFAIKEWL
ncbi:DUF2515 domain-containing protein [Bacillus gobiensis]|uniref:DUF2515 domain-containing protein n=1 Tax=Bacillus gobiensis TaxID=1441095 RepID=UPI003D23690E